MRIKHGMTEWVASDPLLRREGGGAAYVLFCSHRGGRRGLSIKPDRRRQVATADVFSVRYPKRAPGRGAATPRRRSSSPRARQSRQNSVAFHGRQLRSSGSSIQAGKTPQAQGHLDRTVTFAQRRQTTRSRSAAYVTVKLRNLYVVTMPFYGDDQLDITGELLKFASFHTRTMSVTQPSR